MLISGTEFCTRTRVTYRQFDHWSRHGVFGPDNTPGSGNYRRIDDALIPAGRLLGRLQDWTAGVARSPVRGGRGTGLHRSVLTEIVERYADGRWEIAPGVELRWEVEGT